MQPVYPELVAARRCKLAVLGVEVGGRINQEARPPAGGSEGPQRPARYLRVTFRHASHMTARLEWTSPPGRVHVTFARDGAYEGGTERRVHPTHPHARSPAPRHRGNQS